MPSNAPTIAVVGAASVDITLREPPAWMGQTARDVYTPDSLHDLESPVEMTLGGNGAAAAYVLGKLGMRVELYTSIGTDEPGQLARGWLKQANVQCKKTTSAKSTMVNLTAVDDQGKRLGTLLHAGSQLDWSVQISDTAASWLLMTVHSLVTSGEIQAVQHTLQDFQESGRMTALDTGMGWIINRADSKQIHALWSQADIVIGTLDELSHWTAKDDPESIAAEVLNHGAALVVIKMGAEGAAYQSEVESFTHQRAVPVERPNRSIGAGDAFAGALVASLATGQPLSTAVASAQRIAAQVVEAGRGVLSITQLNLEQL